MADPMLKDAYQQFYRQNYYAARDLWEQVLSQTQDQMESAECLNALGATYDRIGGTEAARPYFEGAVRYWDSMTEGGTLSEAALKVRTNLAYVYTRLGHTDAALQVIRETESVPYRGSDLRWALFEVSVLNTYSRAELYDEILLRVPQIETLFQQLETTEVRNRNFASFYQYAGYAAQMKNDMDRAISSYRAALAIFPTPDVWRDLAKAYVLLGNAAEAVYCLDQLHPLIWRLTTVTEKIELAHTLELLAICAWLDGDPSLFKKCAEKAELYFGQESRWSEWLQIQRLETELTTLFMDYESIHMDWEPWSGFLDELNLLDGFHAMFPRFWTILRNSASLAARVYGECRGVGEVRELQVLERATRLAYVGLPAQAISEGEATDILCNHDEQHQLVEFSVKLLDVYPSMKQYQAILGGCRQRSLQPTTREEFMAVALGIALHYVELIELHGYSHRQALAQSLADYHDSSTEITAAFANLFQV